MIDKLEFPFTGPQVILSSDRILLHSKKDAIILAGKRAVSLCSTETINLDAKEKINLGEFSKNVSFYREQKKKI